ncbi:MAG: hypothetical protein U1E69_09035 [Tabrizicola sp.]|uniref:hypothetical protein n=1 Tax=Tabrizicola sp. TaxID=2005166 RepID=UPI002ABA887E|nr:hypothetical protein [Tabrizicola sp.]MDZ4086934.1 hypothetical protein [Tabrizicola sp.]
MPTSLEQVASSFEALGKRVEKVWVPSYPLSTPLNKSIGWQASALAPEDAIILSDSVAERIRGLSNGKKPSEVEAESLWVGLAKQADGLDFANLTSDPINVTRATFEILLFTSSELPPRTVSVDWERVEEHSQIPRRLATRLRALEARLSSLEPRATDIDEKISAIETAHDAAERLPTDLEELRSASAQVKLAEQDSSKAKFKIEEYRGLSAQISEEMKVLRDEAAALVKKCDEAYRITTSAGLAGAFEYRSKSLAVVGWVWVVLLIASLAGAVVLGKDRYDGLRELLVGDHPPGLIYLNVLFAVLGVAAPVWLAWLATRSIGQSFRLSEDYAFKASVSKAYEGYRKEAVTLDEDFAKRLFGSALNRLDEAPSRFIVSEDHNSPLQELLQNESFKKFLSAFPEVQDKLGRYIVDAKSAVSGAVGGVAAVAASGKRPPKEASRSEPSASDTDA